MKKNPLVPVIKENLLIRVQQEREIGQLLPDARELSTMKAKLLRRIPR